MSIIHVRIYMCMHLICTIYIVNHGTNDHYLADVKLVQVHSGPLFTKRTDVLSQDPVTSRSREIRVYTFPVALKFGTHLGSYAADMPIKFQRDTVIITSNITASRFHEIRVRSFTALVNRCLGSSQVDLPVRFSWMKSNLYLTLIDLKILNVHSTRPSLVLDQHIFMPDARCQEIVNDYLIWNNLDLPMYWIKLINGPCFVDRHQTTIGHSLGRFHQHCSHQRFDQRNGWYTTRMMVAMYSLCWFR